MSKINGFEYNRLVKLVRCIEVDLRNFLANPSEYRSQYFEDTHYLTIEVLDILGAEPVEEKETDSEISWEEAWGEAIAKHEDEVHALELENFDPISIAEQREATK
jgi:hypothetical protein